MKSIIDTKLLIRVILVFSLTSTISCKKDPADGLVGNYTGTVIHQYYEPRNATPLIDTLFKNVTVTVRKGTESTSREIRLAFDYNDTSISVPYSSNLRIENAVINETYTNRGAVGTYYRWIGSINSGVIDVIHRVEQYNGSLHLFVIQAVKN